MIFRYDLSIAGVSVRIETDRELKKNAEFAPFFAETEYPDVRVSFQKANALPGVPEKVLYTDQCAKIALDDQGNFRKFFYENNKDPVCYASATYDRRGGSVQVVYLEEYKRCVSEVQNCFFHIGFDAVLLQKNRLCLHAACVDTSLGGILFSGVSGIGKSTQANLWCKYRGAKQINGDRPILSKENGGWTAWGSPYAGSSNVHVNDSCDIAAIVLLKQAERCAIRKLSTAEAFRGVWAGLTVRTWDAAFVERASELTIELATGLPVYEFCCTPDEEAVRFLEEELRKDNNK